MTFKPRRITYRKASLAIPMIFAPLYVSSNNTTTESFPDDVWTPCHWWLCRRVAAGELYFGRDYQDDQLMIWSISRYNNQQDPQDSQMMISSIYTKITIKLTFPSSSARVNFLVQFGLDFTSRDPRHSSRGRKEMTIHMKSAWQPSEYPPPPSI